MKILIIILLLIVSIAPSSYAATKTYYIGAGDGSVSYSASSWDAAHDAETGSAASPTGSPVISITSSVGGPTRTISRVFLPINLTAEPKGVRAASVTLSLYVASKQNSAVDSSYKYVNIVGPTFQADTTTLTTADYDTCDFTGPTPTPPTAWATSVTVSSITTSAYNTWTLNPTAVNALVNAYGGWFLPGARIGYDIDDSAPTGNLNATSVGIAASESIGTSTDPYMQAEAVLPQVM